MPQTGLRHGPCINKSRVRGHDSVSNDLPRTPHPRTKYPPSPPTFDMESTTRSRPSWKAIHIPAVLATNLHIPYHATPGFGSPVSSSTPSPSSSRSLTPASWIPDPVPWAVPTSPPSALHFQPSTSDLLRQKESVIRRMAISIVGLGSVPNLQQLSLLCLSCSVIANAVVEALAHGVDEDLLPVHGLVE